MKKETISTTVILLFLLMINLLNACSKLYVASIENTTDQLVNINWLANATVERIRQLITGHETIHPSDFLYAPCSERLPDTWRRDAA